MKIQRSIWVLAALAIGVAGCGGESTPTEETSASRSSGDERPSEREDGVAITGLMGTIRADQVENALQPRMDRFMRCFQQRMGDVEFLAGNIRLSFRIHTDGTVSWVYPVQSDIGDRAVEQCILEVARAAHFPRPRGGEAEFGWGFGLDSASDVRPPLNWSQEALGALADEVPSVVRACRARGPFSVTAYIEPGGAVLAAGGSMPTAEDAQVLDCILERVRAWSMPDPGSYAAKITFAVR